MNLDLFLALAAAVASGALAIFASWRASQPSNPLKPRLLPWRAIMIAATTCVVIALVVAASLVQNMFAQAA